MNCRKGKHSYFIPKINMQQESIKYLSVLFSFLFLKDCVQCCSVPAYSWKLKNIMQLGERNIVRRRGTCWSAPCCFCCWRPGPSLSWLEFSETASQSLGMRLQEEDCIVLVICNSIALSFHNHMCISTRTCVCRKIYFKTIRPITSLFLNRINFTWMEYIDVF